MFQRANELSDILKDITKNEKFDFFDLHFIKNPINEVVTKNKINVPDLLEAVDSLHPNQVKLTNTNVFHKWYNLLFFLESTTNLN